MTYDDPWSAFQEQLHRTTLRSPVRIKCCGADGMPPSVDVGDCTGHFVQRLFVCAIPEDLVDAASKEMPMPWLSPTALNTPIWVHKSRPCDLAKLLHDDLTDGYPALPEAICSLASSMDNRQVKQCLVHKVAD